MPVVAVAHAMPPPPTERIGIVRVAPAPAIGRPTTTGAHPMPPSTPRSPIPPQARGHSASAASPHCHRRDPLSSRACTATPATVGIERPQHHQLVPERIAARASTTPQTRQPVAGADRAEHAPLRSGQRDPPAAALHIAVMENRAGLASRHAPPRPPPRWRPTRPRRDPPRRIHEPPLSWRHRSLASPAGRKWVAGRAARRRHDGDALTRHDRRHTRAADSGRDA